MLTLNIEDNSLRIALIKGKRVVAAIEEPLPAGSVQNGIVIDKQGVSEIIKGLLSKHAITEKEVLACVSGIHSIYRVVSVPKLDRKLLAEVSRKEMERVSPVSLDTLYMAWQEIRSSGAESSLCLMGLPHDNVDSVTDTIKLCGLKAKTVELKPLVVARVIDAKTAVTVNIQPGSYDITIVDKNVPEMIRSLSFPAENMTDDEKSAVVKEELGRTISFYNSSHAGRQLNDSTACYISGMVSSQFIQQLGYVVKPLPEPFTYPMTIDKARFAANTGLALGAGRESGLWAGLAISVSIGKGETQTAPKTNAAPLVVLAIGACIIAALFVVNGTIAQETTRLKALVDEKTKQVTDIQKLLRDDRDKIVKQRDELKAQLGQLKSPLEQLNKSRVNINRDIGQAIAVTPGVMYLVYIGYTEEVITISGLAPDSETIMSYARSLRETGLFRQVNITSLNNRTYNDTRFSLVLVPTP